MAKEIGRLRKALAEKPAEEPDLLEGDGPVLASAAVAGRQEQYEALEVLVEAGALERVVVAASVLADLAETLSSPQPGTTGMAAVMSEHVLGQVPQQLANAEADAASSLLEAVDGSPWL